MENEIEDIRETVITALLALVWFLLGAVTVLTWVYLSGGGA